MAGFNKDVVLDALRGHLDDAIARADKHHEDEVKGWEKQRHAIQNGKKRLRQYVRDLTAEKISIEEFASTLKSGFDRYGGWADQAHREVPPKPARLDSIREKQLKRVISIVDAVDAETVTVSDLRGLGVLDLVKLPASCR